MTALNSYSTGTATVSAGGTTVTGTGTIWSGVNARPGDIFQIGNYQSVISDVVDTGTLTIPPWGGGAQTAVSYKIWQVSPQRFAGAQAMADVSTLVAALNTDGFFFFVDTTETVPDPSLGNDGQYAFQPTTGKTWVKSGGVWTYLGIFKAFQLRGAWSGATAYSVGDVVSLSGSSYACVLDHTNHTPPNATYWQLLAGKGDTGATGATGAGYGGTSTTSLTIGTGSKAFTTQSGLAYQNGARVRASSAANTSNWMEGLATYSGTALTITVDKTNGSGTLADWNLNIVGQPGAGDVSSANALSEYTGVAATARANLGIKQAVALAASQDFNAVTSPGTYYTVDASSTNAPSAAFYFLRVETGSGLTVTQWATLSNNTISYVRARDFTGVWTTWKQIVDWTGAGHLPGIAGNTAASTGEVGEVISASGTSGSLSNGVVAALGSISLTAGDWDVSATVQFNASGGTTSTDYNGAISTTTASLTPYGTSIAFTQRIVSSADHSENFVIPPVQALINSTTSFYLNARSAFTGTAPTSTWSIRARRMR
ncbi:carbohydrate-binding protein [Bradyrhizobium genosp. SA-3]|uniref:carbohydrate-binding protein n=1 Tax=Bradyrhizobium genosp. SA-3 TaxID=508868 RepID=UPI001FE228C5|nr:carbohydrate-binding protein [Bradyrhizobium genosp. SA-3]